MFEKWAKCKNCGFPVKENTRCINCNELRGDPPAIDGEAQTEKMESKPVSSSVGIGLVLGIGIIVIILIGLYSPTNNNTATATNSMIIPSESNEDKAINTIKNYNVQPWNIPLIQYMAQIFQASTATGNTYDLDSSRAGWVAICERDLKVYRVEFHFIENLVEKETSWLVDISTGQVVPKDVMAQNIMGK